MDTFCIRSWNWYLVDLDTMESKMCCKTPWTPMDQGGDWFNNSHMRRRRHDQLNGVQTADCKHCWQLENQGHRSPRESWGRELIGVDVHDPAHDAMLELIVGNTCDMACRYCKSKDSSIWAQRLGVYEDTKLGRAQMRQSARYTSVLAEFYQWLRATPLKKIIISGGEPFIMESFYHFLINVQLKNIVIQINSNLNTPPAYLPRAIAAVQGLLDNGNTVIIRASLEGVGNKQEWQRQGSDWPLITENYLALGATGCQMTVATTVTMLTLEGIGELGQFVAASARQLPRLPKWEKNNIVTWPQPLAPHGWFGCFQDEIYQLYNLMHNQNLGIDANGVMEQLEDWLSLSDDLPIISQAQATVEYLDSMETNWGGGEWRKIYPKTAAIAQRLLDQRPT